MQTFRHQDIEQAIRELASSARPGTFYMALRELTLNLLQEGHIREELLDSYERAAHELREQDSEELGLEVLEVMAELEGWCSPHARL